MSKSAPKPRRSWLRRLLLLLLLGVLVAGAGVAWLWQQYQLFNLRPVAGLDAETDVILQRGDGLRRVLQRLQQAGLEPGREEFWRLLAREMEVGGRIQAGEYRLPANATPRALLQQFADGRVLQRRVTIVEGMNFRELRLALSQAEVLEQTLPGLGEAEIMRRLDAEGVPAEGRFLPETYYYTRGMSDLDVLRRAKRALDRALEQAWAKRQPDLPLQSPDEALILASIIEKETGIGGERRQVSGVFNRRLRIGMRLQTDPTVIYGVGDAYRGVILRSHLDTDTPWNTYTRDGLPPTPIAMPGRAAIEAAVDPAPGDALYFVASGDGGHVFSRTLAEHNRAVARWRARERSR
ncbi:endolytic transglycosylase MltG [Aquimonas sp.]|uniref:endolytic transglycosylase MltG n=1 Tax=Aquimonas sp. TaxID=1872588 RepID=UPI0037BF3602